MQDEPTIVCSHCRKKIPVGIGRACPLCGADVRREVARAAAGAKLTVQSGIAGLAGGLLAGLAAYSLGMGTTVALAALVIGGLLAWLGYVAYAAAAIRKPNPPNQRD